MYQYKLEEPQKDGKFSQYTLASYLIDSKDCHAP